MKGFKHDARFGYTLASGRLFMEMADFQEGLEELLERPVFTHEMGSKDFWAEAKEAFEAMAVESCS
jgi:hypothetical protein